MRFSIKNSKEELGKYLLLLGFTYKEKTDLPDYYSCKKDSLIIIAFMVNLQGKYVFNIAVYKHHNREVYLNEEEAFDFLNNFFEIERRKLTILNLLKILKIDELT